jgi:LPPG:FO 2-phospho-L-lactate transferase
VPAGDSHTPASEPVTVIAGGVGAARMLAALLEVVPAERVTAVANVGDDLVLHGLHISPDLDTITYTLAGQINPDTGWGLAGESWQAMETLGRYGGVDWFNLGDRDLGTHLYRTHRMGQGATLTEVTAEIVSSWGLGLRVLPVTDDPLRTMVTLAEGDHRGREITFQEYFVQLAALRGGQRSAIRRRSPGQTRSRGASCHRRFGRRVVDRPVQPGGQRSTRCWPCPGSVTASSRRAMRTVAVSPIVGGAALKGPADRLLRELGHEASVVRRSPAGTHPWHARLVIDEVDAALADAVHRRRRAVPVVAPTIMSSAGTLPPHWPVRCLSPRCGV